MQLLRNLDTPDVVYQVSRDHPMGRSEAWVSHDNRERYALRCTFPITKPLGHRPVVFVFLMLNPSYADAYKYDATATRCMKRAISAGVDACILINLFSYRTPNPRELILSGPSVESALNDAVLDSFANRQSPLIPEGAETLIICGWGSHGVFLDKGARVALSMVRQGAPLYTLRETQAGHPGHPLYLPYHLQPYEWVPSKLVGSLQR